MGVGLAASRTRIIISALPFRRPTPPYSGPSEEQQPAKNHSAPEKSRYLLLLAMPDR
ncbi:uncharacterized protein BDW70DRAFT_138358, partial [Aspergillus foveolatus]|uniref:uncharacterized protein n=1 Tax=Aspergillus foveolatus TaxID=210207 RepID=UPI003CCDB44F